jgi:ABC-type multidrug transport system permease subunit
MNEPLEAPKPARSAAPLWNLVVARLREFYREPEAVFWVYGFPIVMIVALGIAFRSQTVATHAVDIQAGPHAARLQEELSKQEKFKVEIHDAETCRVRLRRGKSALTVVVQEGPKPTYEYWCSPTSPEGLLVRKLVDDVLQQDAGRKDPLPVKLEELNEPGGRYIDFLVPGLLGMSLMGGGLFGVGFVTVDMRIRKLLKRFLATPMKKRDFLAGLMISRLFFMIPEVLVVLVFAWLAFGVYIYGSLLAVVVLIFVGAFCFAGVGLLVGSRVRTLEAASGLLNLVMMPMWLFSGVFFSSERFPDVVQPFVQALPLTPLNNALRAVMLEGASLASQLPAIGILAAWGIVSFALALRWFRWS